MYSKIHTDKRLTVTINGKRFVKEFDSEKKLLKFLGKLEEEKSMKKRIEMMSPAGLILRDKRFYFNSDKQLCIKGFEHPFPARLSKKILQSLDNGLSVNSLVNFWAKCHLNPEWRAIEELYDFLEYTEITLTEEGDIIGYKSVEEVDGGFRPFHNRNSWLYVIDEEARMKYEEVDADRNRTCSHGLHVGSMEYVTAFGSSDRAILVVKVSPADVVSVPADYNGQKLRSCAFTPLYKLEK